MAQEIQALFVDPPLAFARLGASSAPQNAYEWVQSEDVHLEGETAIKPAWSLSVRPDASVEPFMPGAIAFRDNAEIRPVAPFFEVWALMGEPGSDPSTWQEAPLTPALLASHDAGLDALRVAVDARNRKAERRTGNSNLAFGTFPSVEIRADDHAVKALGGVSPPGANPSMIPANRQIPLGSVQVLRSLPQPAAGTTPWADRVNIEVIRFRFTPAKGLMYGPPQAAANLPVIGPAVGSGESFLNAAAGWFGATPASVARAVPWDTYDGAESDSSASLGVVDDTCEARIEVTVRLPGPPLRTLRASTSVFVGPPDFSPDRRPFLSAADEINDRSAGQAERTAALTNVERTAWIEDLFERVYETVSLFNVDYYRSIRAASLPQGEQLPPIPNDGVPPTPPPPRAMSSVDRLRDRNTAIAAPTLADPLPLSERGRSRHRVLSDAIALRNFVLDNPARLSELIRPPFGVGQREGPARSNMQMPPFMRNSNANPLALAAWQYDFLMAWNASIAAGVIQPEAVAIGGAPGAAREAVPGRRISPDADRRRSDVLRSLRQ